MTESNDLDDLRLLFFPGPNSGRSVGENVRVSVKCDGATLVCFRRDAHSNPSPQRKWLPPKTASSTTAAKQPTVIHFHGNGELSEDYAEWSPIPAPQSGDFQHALCDVIGCSVVWAEYRGYGESSGVPGIKRCLADSLCVIPALGVDCAEAVVWGRSIGSLMALHVAETQRPKAVVLECGIASLEGVFAGKLEIGETRSEANGQSGIRSALRKADSETVRAVEKAAGYVSNGGHLLLIHCEDDTLVPISHSEEILAACTAKASGCSGSVELLRLKRGGHQHTFGMNSKAITGKFREFIDRVFHAQK